MAAGSLFVGQMATHQTPLTTDQAQVTTLPLKDSFSLSLRELSRGGGKILPTSANRHDLQHSASALAASLTLSAELNPAATHLV